jgi:ribosomal protein S18 acetylase RimI-like enzyme
MSDDRVSLAPDLILAPMTAELAGFFGPELAAIEPWSQINYPAHRLTAFLAAADPALTQKAVFVGDRPAGVIAVRSPWLHGPYLQLLALLPPFQSRGLGAHLLRWFEEQAKPQHRWLWLCHSRFNTRAGAFYARHGFEVTATLPDLLADGEDEILMRKRINTES